MTAAAPLAPTTGTSLLRAPKYTLALAPMEGVTDVVFRALYADELGGLDYCVTEFVRVSGQPLGARTLARECPELERAARTKTGVPVHVQLLGGDAGRVAETAAVAAGLGAAVIDLNFGCPAPTVNRHDGGATLLKDPARVMAVTRAVREAVPAAVQVSAKVRLGWEDPDDVERVVCAAEQGGAAWITVHGRTRAQGYKPPADWARVGRARAAVRVPVVANGDITSLDELHKCAEITGCTRFMMGRGAIAKPELFRVLAGLDAREWEPWRRLEVLERYAVRSLAEGPGRENGTLGRMKQWLRAMAQAEPALAGGFERLKRLTTLDETRAGIALECERLRASGVGPVAEARAAS